MNECLFFFSCMVSIVLPLLCLRWPLVFFLFLASKLWYLQIKNKKRHWHWALLDFPHHTLLSLFDRLATIKYLNNASAETYTLVWFFLPLSISLLLVLRSVPSFIGHILLYRMLWRLKASQNFSITFLTTKATRGVPLFTSCVLGGTLRQ